MHTSIAFFNNKGGVGKTTLACNFSYFLTRCGYRVTVIDCDPQSNATQLLLEEASWEEIYEDKGESERRTILKALSHIRAGDSSVDHDIELQRSDKFAVDVLAGHPSLSIIEDLLSASWTDFSARQLGGARRTLWSRELVKGLNSDIAIFDLGPSLGALNRSVLLGCDFFVTPVAADLFSLYALENIGEWLQASISTYSENWIRLGRETNQLSEYDVPEDLPIGHGWSGYSVQQYVAKTSGGKVRGIQAYDRYKQEIPSRAEKLHEVQSLSMKHEELGIVPNMFSMVPMAQAAHAPIEALTPSDGVRGAQVAQQAKYVDQLNAMFGRLKENLSL